MTDILAFLEDRSSWQASREYLVSAFEEIPDLDASRLSKGRSEMRDLGWSFEHNGQQVEAWIAREGWGISVDGGPRAGILLAVWFRSVVPAPSVVRISDSMYSFDRELTVGESVEQVQDWYEDNVGELH